MTRAENMARARAWVAQAWCTPTTSHKVMDVELAEAMGAVLLAAVRAKGEAALSMTVDFDTMLLRNLDTKYGRGLVEAGLTACLRAHIADVPEVPQ